MPALKSVRLPRCLSRCEADAEFIRTLFGGMAVGVAIWYRRTRREVDVVGVACKWDGVTWDEVCFGHAVRVLRW